MKTMCPYCGGEKCEKCNNTGQIDVRIPAGDIYTRWCEACQWGNGGAIVGPESYKSVDDLPKAKPCIRCGGPTEWKCD